MADTSPADFDTIEPWVWTMSSAFAFMCFIVVPDRLKESEFAYASLTAMTINCHYSLWSVQVSEWVYLLVEGVLESVWAPERPRPPMIAVPTYGICVGTLLVAIWQLHARAELEARRVHRMKRPDDYRRDVPLIPSWGLMTLWMLSFCLLFQWVGGLHILMSQVYPAATCIGIMLMIFVP